MKINVIQADLGHVYGEALYLDEKVLENVFDCPVCHYEKEKKILARAEAGGTIGLTISHCLKCDHIYLSRRPTQQWYQSYYEETWDSGRLELPHNNAVSRLKHRMKRRPVLDQAARFLKTLAGRERLPQTDEKFLLMLAGIAGPDGHRLGPGSKALEIGSGYGGALFSLRSIGFDVTGTEANQHRAAACRAEGVRVLETPIDDLETVKPYGPFDLVYSAHVFEHLSNLDAMMENLQPLVRERGLIYIEVPNGAVAENLIHRVHVPLHCHLFSGRSLSTLLTRHGFGLMRLHADINLHVIAKKGVESALPVPGFSDNEALRRGIDVLGQRGGKAVFQYDANHVEIDSVDDGERWYEHPDSYGNPRETRSDGHTLVNRFFLQGTEASRDETIRFIHSSERPPVWLKRQ